MKADKQFADALYAKAEQEPDKTVQRALCALAEIHAGSATQLTVPIADARKALSEGAATQEAK